MQDDNCCIKDDNCSIKDDNHSIKDDNNSIIDHSRSRNDDNAVCKMIRRICAKIHKYVQDDNCSSKDWHI